MAFLDSLLSQSLLLLQSICRSSLADTDPSDNFPFAVTDTSRMGEKFLRRGIHIGYSLIAGAARATKRERTNTNLMIECRVCRNVER